MFSHISKAVVPPGKTVPLVLDMLPGSPVLHVEHLGESNQQYWNDQIARANTAEARVGDRANQAITKRGLKKRRDKDRETLAKFSVRDIEARHTDGTPATKEDIPDFLEACPDDVIDTIRDFVINPDNFRERGAAPADPSDTAEK